MGIDLLNLMDLSFWSNFLSNLLATFAGILVGVPAALWVGGIQERSLEKEKRKKILRLLYGELLRNLTMLSGWKGSSDKTLETLLMGSFLETELWKSFADSGELSWLKEPELIEVLAYAYAMIRHVAHFSDRYELMQRNEAKLKKRALNYFERAIDETIIDIRSALRAIASNRVEQG